MAQQAARTWTPPELKALRALTRHHSTITPRLLIVKKSNQGKAGLVPGGVLSSVVWEVVPGIRLGTVFGTDVFWAMSEGERHVIRETFREGLTKLSKWGDCPIESGGESLVWDRATSTL
ncbi:hypothetical protein BO70DRAFT_398717 [Aspergillus heteromorphus CBS 117.55]|uniref:Uncharacterized protein n=1 Tax=Aspergillus heteromorphus CBS 117.55 TaxID=1448321 RepID=A0A317VJ77_9EURO|nr:uncharacterized protein BO70DRAFT_398717 [Aspergillus heteromorphus CBS 117.55]PWY74393.1 hypothetical protein BO70DRAFT_398717 [Aspergillus heteromorphus CBS 117.55]